MLLLERKQETNFYLPKIGSELEEKGVLVYTDQDVAEFDIAKCLEYNFNFIICFHYQPVRIDILENKFKARLQDDTWIMWLDSFDEESFNKSLVIKFNNNIVSQTSLNIYRGPEISSSDTKSSISYNKDEKVFTLKSTEDDFMFKANGREKIPFKEIKIPISESIHQKKFGSLVFDLNTSEKSVLKFHSPYLVKEKGPFGDFIKSELIDYFTDKSFGENVIQQVTYFPYKDYDNSSKLAPQSYIEYKVREGKKALGNILNDKARNYEVDNFDNFRSVLVKLDYGNTTKFLFIPDHESKIVFKDRKENGLVTNNKTIAILGSGGELIESANDEIEIKFTHSDELFVDKEKNVISKVEEINGLTAICNFSNYTYNLDSEKSPLFNNSPDNNGAVDYKPLFYSEATSEPLPLPIIPTLSLIDNPDLLELEEVFKKIRLRAHKDVRQKQDALDLKQGKKVFQDDEERITPNGFIRTTNGYEFIKKEGKYSFSLEGVINTDIDLSLRKDKVFFVLTPELLESYNLENPQLKAKLDAKFKIHKDLKFFINLNLYYKKEDSKNEAKENPHSKTIIIVASHNMPFTELIKNPKLWSNEGAIVGQETDLEDILEALKVCESIAKSDVYFKNNIYNSSSWNGVLILNIPINKPESLPPIFKGIGASQNLFGTTPKEGLELNTKFEFQYVAFPTNKTSVNNNNKYEVEDTSFYGSIDYNPFKNDLDYKKIFKFLTEEVKKENFKFVLSKLKINFSNSSIKLQSSTFLKVPKLLDDEIEIGSIDIVNKGDENEDYAKPPRVKRGKNLIRLDGALNEIEDGEVKVQTISFSANTNLEIKFTNNEIIEKLNISKVGFQEIDEKFAFDIDAKPIFSKKIGKFDDLFSIKDITIRNIRFDFSMLDSIEIPVPEFKWSAISIDFPKIEFDGKGLLGSFPVKFSSFNVFKYDQKKIDYDYITLPDFPDLPKIPKGKLGNLFSFIFDMDLGTLGDLGGLKGLKAKLLLGWTPKGGFVVGFKLDGSINSRLNIDLFGALKLQADITLCRYGENNSFFLLLNDASVTVFGTRFPDKEKTLDGVIFANPGNSKKTAWLLTLIDGKDSNPAKNKLLIAAGQRVKLEDPESVLDSILKVKKSLNVDDLTCDNSTAITKLHAPERNWLVASERILPEKWPLDLQFIFNDPNLYGLYLGFKKGGLEGFSVDILYKKLSDNVGVYSTDIQLPNKLRNQKLGGGGDLTFPNFGVEIFTNGDWSVDIGYPLKSDDWSRSGFLQLNTSPPLVGWFGFYLRQSKLPENTLFKDYFKKGDVNIIQAGFAMRVGMGKYLDEGILFIGASITVYGILEGAFAFEKNDTGLQTLLPDHFALRGRLGAIAEIVGYVDFKVTKASVRMSLQAEFGFLFVYLGKNIQNDNNSYKKGIQPVKVYVTATVNVRIRVKIYCVRFFRKKWCLYINFSFKTQLRFEYTIGGDGNSKKLAFQKQMLQLSNKLLSDGEENIINIKKIGAIPMVFIPGFTQSKEDGDKLFMVANFYIPFFGKEVDNLEKLIPSKRNIFKDSIVGPFFKELLSKLPPKFHDYDSIRKILLDVEDNIYEIRVPNYRPHFVKGVNSNDEEVLKKILKDHFKFDEDQGTTGEINTFIKNESCNDGVLNKCPYRAITAPISSKIKIGDNIEETIDGFKISVENLTKNGETTFFDINDNIKITDPHKEKIDNFFNSYKTQFLERKSDKNKLDDPGVDIRENVIIPEYFKLIALITLEKAYNKFNDLKKEEESYNPIVSIDDNNDLVLTHVEKNNSLDIEVKNTLEINKYLDELIGQINYFYNSGLRIPESETSNNTVSILNYLHQLKEIPREVSNNGWEKVKVQIGNTDFTTNIFGEGDDREESIKSTKAYANSLKSIDLSNEFNEPIEVELPYKLVDVTLGISNDYTVISDSKRFYEIPKKLFAQGVSKEFKYNFELVGAKYDAKNSNVKPEDLGKDELLFPNVTSEKCLNIEVKVRKTDVEVTKDIWELINVKAEDLTLMNLLKEDSDSINNINIYEKNESGLVHINANTLIKTNLSVRTSPPIFKTSNTNKLLEDDKSVFIANTENKPNFIQLLWEALTTNNGGYYLVSDKTEQTKNDGDTVKDESTIMISFAIENTKEIPYYFNALLLDNEQNQLDEQYQLFDKIDSNEVYLYLKDLQQDEKSVKEYHATMAPHTFGFSLERSLPKANENDPNPSSQYLPLEFDITQENSEDTKFTLLKDEVLPIMPKDPDDNNMVESGNLLYSHVSPLVDFVKNKDINRYSAVGETFELSVGVRDIYGMRWSENPIKTEKHTQKYFDKLIPIESWPLIKFSYWLNDENKWEVTGSFDILEVLDLAGTNKKYSYPEPITDKKDVNKVIETLSGLIERVDIIYDQVRDKNVNITISGQLEDCKKNIKEFVSALRTKLNELSKVDEDNSIKLPEKKYGTNTISIPCVTAFFETEDDKLFKELEFKITLERKKDNLQDIDDEILKDNIIWDYLPVVSTFSKIAIGAPRDQKGNSDVDKLNKYLKERNTGVSLALSTNKKLEKVLYLVNEAKLKALQISDQNPDEDKVNISENSFFGIKPISNKLYEGKTDLDVGLRVILEKIDELLSGKHLAKVDFSGKENKSLYSNLIQAKKDLVLNKLSPQIDWVLKDNEVDSETKNTFNEIILDRLSNFYAYDGVIATKLNDVIPNDIRLSISLTPQEGYELYSSKISHDKWNIFFDKLEKVDASSLSKREKKNKDFSIIPSITHIEILEEGSSANQIQTTQWLQLVEPIKINKKYDVKGFPHILRKYPPVPEKLEHTAGQAKDATKLGYKWELDKSELEPEKKLPRVGNWNYKLNLTGDYKEGDRLEFVVVLEDDDKSSLDSSFSFNDFIAKWHPLIIKENEETKIELKDFVEDLEISLNTSSEKNDLIKNKIPINFIFQKNDNAWEEVVNSKKERSYKAKLEVDENVSTQLIFTLIGNNIFDSNQINLVNAKVKAIRNGGVTNPEFQYETGYVSPASPARVLAEYNQPLCLKNDENEDFETLVFAPLEACGLSYKMTTKYIIPLDKELPEDAKYLTEISSKLTQKSGGKSYLEISDEDDFDGFDENNGFQAYSLTVFDKKGLTVFKADTIYKRKN